MVKVSFWNCLYEWKKTTEKHGLSGESGTDFLADLGVSSGSFLTFFDWTVLLKKMFIHQNDKIRNQKKY